MGIAQASYGTYITPHSLSYLKSLLGIGAFAAPLVATQFAQMKRWSFHYLVSLGLAISNTIFLAAIFKFRRQTGQRIPP